MKRLLALSLVFFTINLFTSLASSAELSVPKYLQEISVTVQGSGGTGSGVLFTRKGADGQIVNLVWTAGHVVNDLRATREVVTPDGAKRTIIEFQDAKVVKQLIEDGRIVGRLEIDAEVIRYSNADDGEDLAILKIRKKNFVESSTTARFYLTNVPPEIGTELLHVGSLKGQFGANSLTSGIYSQHGRLLGKTVFDQTTCAAFPGSSGGGVFLRDGQYIGMLVRGAGETFNLIVPVRRMWDWSKKAKVEWALNPNVPMPSEEDLKKLPIEDVGKNFASISGVAKSEYHFWLYHQPVVNETPVMENR
jgi:S1-C subfamily serine protease